MTETPIVEQERGEQRLIRTWAGAAEQVLERLTHAKPKLHWARRPAVGSTENLATLEWWEASYEAGGEHRIWIGIAGPVTVEVNRLAQALASAGSQQTGAASISSQQTVESLCETFATMLAAESDQRVEFQGLQRLDGAPSPEVLYSTEMALETGPAPILVGFKARTNAVLRRLIDPPSPGADAAQPAEAGQSAALGLLLDLELPLSVRFGRAQMPLERVLELRPGSVVELDGSQDEPVDLLVNGSVVARGEVVAVEGHYAIRILEVLSRNPKIEGSRPSNQIQGA
jgi:flagellar motor switch protein FliN/FliY